MVEEKFRRVYACLNKEALVHNVGEVRRKAGQNARMMAVVKANAYGHGIENLVPILLEEKVDAFAVASMWEAEQLYKVIRDTLSEEAFLNLKETLMILVLGYTDPSEYATGIRLGINMAIYSLEQAKEMANVVRELQKESGDDSLKAHVQIKVETGMQRIGFPAVEESAETVRMISAMEEIRIEGVFTHFARADEVDKSQADLQEDRFENFLGMLEEKGVSLPFVHSANSAAIMEYDRAFKKEGPKKLVRAGIMLYGLYPSEEMDRENVVLEPVMKLVAHVIHAKEVPAGAPIGYGGTFVTEKPTRVATISVGYGDGYPRHLSNSGYMMIHGKKAPILGRVCMDQTMVDITDIPEAKVGDEVLLFGKELPLDDLAKIAGTISYEIVCQLSLRVKRVL